MARGFIQGRYTPKNPKKYRGDLNDITYRSSWELSFCQFLDNNPNIINWSCEEIAIPYVKPTDKKVHRYFPDFWIKYKNRHGEIVQEIIEIKPSTQTKQPRRVGKNRKTQIHENVTYAINVAKWAAASEFCNNHGIKFRLMTERELFK